MKLWRVIAFAIISCSLSLSVMANESDTLAKLLESNRNIEGSFKQVTFDENGKERQRSEGTFVLAQPNKFVWDTVDPFPQKIISDGSYITIWDIDLEQATRKPFKKALGNSPAALLSRPADKVLPNYHVVQLSNDSFQLDPLDDDGLFSTLNLKFKQNTIASMEIMDSLDQKTIIDFQKIKHHSGVEDAQFHVSLPDDVDLIVEDH